MNRLLGITLCGALLGVTAPPLAARAQSYHVTKTFTLGGRTKVEGLWYG